MSDEPKPYGFDRLIWIDLEATGLTPQDQILEVACIVTNSNLDDLYAGSWVVKPIEPFVTNNFVLAMHTRSGLLTECVGPSAHAIAAVDACLETVFGTLKLEKGECLLAGSTVQWDKGMMAIHMPRTHAFFNYRVFDVSTLKAAALTWWGKEWPKDDPVHRAMSDIRYSIRIAKDVRALASKDAGKVRDEPDVRDPAKFARA